MSSLTLQEWLCIFRNRMHSILFLNMVLFSSWNSLSLCASFLDLNSNKWFWSYELLQLPYCRTQLQRKRKAAPEESTFHIHNKNVCQVHHSPALEFTPTSISFLFPPFKHTHRAALSTSLMSKQSCFSMFLLCKTIKPNAACSHWLMVEELHSWVREGLGVQCTM